MPEARQHENEQPVSPSRPSDFDIHLFHEGTHARLHRHLGAHTVEHDGERSVAPPQDSIDQ